MRFFIGLLLFFPFSQSAFCQIGDTLYLDDNLQVVQKELATYYRLLQVHPEGVPKLFATTYYLSGQIRSNATCTNPSCITMDGYYVSYYENGNMEQEGERIGGLKSGDWKEWYENGHLKQSTTYEGGVKRGIWKTWYENGQPKEVGESVGDWKTATQFRDKVISHWNAAGEQTVHEGNGMAVYYHKDSTSVSEIGEYREGFKEGLWKGYTEDHDLRYEEFFDQKVVKGVSWDSLENEYTYQQLEVQPTPDGGLKKFYKYLSRNLKYPKEARKLGVEGIVYVQFEVDKGGRLVNVEAIKGIGSGCDKAAVQLVQQAPSWKAGKLRGQPVKVRMILPITFKIG